MSGQESLFHHVAPKRLIAFSFRHRFHVPAVPYGDNPRCKRCGVPMWANYAGYGVKR